MLGGHPAMAAAMGVSATTVMRDLHKSNPPDENGMISYRMILGTDGKRHPGRRFNTTARDSHICELRDAGQSIRAIAADVRCSVGTVHRVLKGGGRPGVIG
jgi:hypothetical protein